MQNFLILNSLFNTIECKTDSCALKVTNFSFFGINSHKTKLSDINYEKEVSKFSYASWSMILIGVSVVSVILSLKTSSTLINNNFISLIVFTICCMSSLFFIFKTEDKFVYKINGENKALLKISQNSKLNTEFLFKLNKLIDEEKNTQSSKRTSKIGKKEENRRLADNVTELFNLGFIDEGLFNTINQRIQKPKVKNKTKISLEKAIDNTTNNVIYLYQN